MPARIIAVDDLARIDVAGGVMRPVRRTLGVTALGVNAYTADAPGDQLIEEHDETGSGSGGHEELYVVLHGRARFVVDGVAYEAAAGTLLLVPELDSRRSATALEAGTTVLVVGGRPGAGLPVAPFEHWFLAEPAYRAGRFDEAYAIAAEGLVDWPHHGHLHYQLACYAALAGRTAEALVHLERALAADPALRAWAVDDDDLAALRMLPGSPIATDG